MRVLDLGVSSMNLLPRRTIILGDLTQSVTFSDNVGHRVGSDTALALVSNVVGGASLGTKREREREREKERNRREGLAYTARN